MENLLDKIKQENADIEIKQEEICFELIEVENSLIDRIKEESVLSNVTEKEYDGLEIDRNIDVDDIQESKIVEFVHVKEEVEDIWTEPEEYTSDPLALFPAVNTGDGAQYSEIALDSLSRNSCSKDVEFPCAKCGSKFKDCDQCHKHIKKFSFSRKSTLLENSTICDYSTKILGNFKTHMRMDTGEKPYKCAECDFSAASQSNLKFHMIVHTEEKPCKCTECDYSAACQSILKVHMSLHTGEKPYKCTNCDYSTATHNKLKIHMRVHTGEKPYKCSDCDYAAAQKQSLIRHSRIHTGEKPYKCVECDYGGACKRDVKNHMRVHTRKKKL